MFIVTLILSFTLLTLVSSEPHAKHKFDFGAFRTSEIGSKYSNVSDSWLEWFIGFTEGDGAILTYPSGLFFVLTQKESQPLHHIQEVLGIGRVKEFTTKEGKKFYRLIVSDLPSILLLCILFNGNLVLPHRIKQLGEWILVLNTRPSLLSLYGKDSLLPLVPNVTPVTPSLLDGWLSGFTDAEGCFNCYETARSFVLRFILDQNDGKSLFETLITLIGAGNVIKRSTTKNVHRLVVSNLTGISVLLAYFNNFPLKTKKLQAFLVWCKIYEKVKDKEHLTNEGHLTIKKLRETLAELNDNN